MKKTITLILISLFTLNVNSQNKDSIIEPLAKKVTQYSQNLLQYTVDSGLIDQKLATKLIKEYPEYVPLNRVFSEIEKSGIPGVGTKALTSLSKSNYLQCNYIIKMVFFKELKTPGA